MHIGSLNDEKVLNNIYKYLKFLLIALPALFILLFIIMAVLRMPYPFDLEWFEGGMVEHVYRLFNGQAIYTKPSFEFIPFIYPPVYFYASEFASEVFGIGYFPLRFVSFVSTLTIIFFIYLIVSKETKQHYLGIISAGLFAACYELSGFWYDMARVDSLFLAFIIIAVFILRFYNGMLALFLAAIFSALAFLTKQTAVIIILPLTVYLIYFHKWKSLFYIIPLLIMSLGFCAYMNWLSEGWFYYWMFELPTGHSWVFRKFVTFWTADILHPLSFAVAMSIVYFLLTYKKKEFRNSVFFLITWIGFMGCAWLSRIHRGGFDNVLTPAFIIIAILFSLGINELNQFISEHKIESRKLFKIVIALAILAQFFSLYYNPILEIPKKQDYAYGKQFVEELKKYDGDVYIPDHQYISRYAGKKSFSHFYVLMDFFGNGSEYRHIVKSEFNDYLEKRKFSTVIMDYLSRYDIIEKYYKFDKPMFYSDDYFKSNHGRKKSRPEFLFIPKE